MIGTGSKFYHETTEGSGTYVEVNACITNISGPNGSVDEIDESCLRATGAVREKEPGMEDPGQVSIDLVWDKTSHNTLYGLRRSKRLFKIEYPEGSYVYGSAFMSGWGQEIPADEKISNTFTFTLSGEWTFVPAV
jgi:hypothetical protein